MNIKTYIAAAVVALTAACSQGQKDTPTHAATDAAAPADANTAAADAPAAGGKVDQGGQEQAK